MPAYLITGRQGSGKTSLIYELQKRGFTAHNTDDLEHVTKLENKQTGENKPFPTGQAVDWTEWSWNWQEDELKNLIASDEIVFIGGVVSNQVEFYDLFEDVFVIMVSEHTLRQRLSQHEHESHAQPGEIDRIAKNHEARQAVFLEEGAKPLEGESSTSKITDELLSRLGLPNVR